MPARNCFSLAESQILYILLGGDDDNISSNALKTWPTNSSMKIMYVHICVCIKVCPTERNFFFSNTGILDVPCIISPSCFLLTTSAQWEELAHECQSDFSESQKHFQAFWDFSELDSWSCKAHWQPCIWFLLTPLSQLDLRILLQNVC